MDVDVSMYDAQAVIIDVDDIANNTNNQFVIRRLKRNNADDTNNDILRIRHLHYDYGEDCVDYVPEEAQ